MERNELSFARSAIGEQHSFDMIPTFSIGFDKALLPDRRSSVAFLTAAVNTAEEIVSEVEAVCFRLGFIKRHGC
jgi:hypothetical protein